MDWKEVGRTVARSAPALGAALGGPAGAAVGGLVAAAFGTDATPAAVSAAIAADPNAAVKLQEAQLRHAEAIMALVTTDVQHARAAHQNSRMPAVLTLALFGLVVGLVAALMWIPTPASNAEVIYLITGQIIGAFATAIAYWLGSSRGSVDKQRALEQRG
jgi:hypothetical protein